MTDQNTSLVAQVAASPGIVLLDEGRFEDYLTKLREEALKVGTDVSTAAKRQAIKSKAFEIVKVRTSIEAEAKRLKEDAQKTIKSVNAAQKPVTERLDELAKEIRGPLTRYEDEEKARVEQCKEKVQVLREAAVIVAGETSETIAARLAQTEQTEIREADFPVLFDAAVAFRDQAITALTAGLARVQQEEADRAELEALRIAAAERAEADRIAEEERVAAERAAEEAAQKEADRVRAVEAMMKHITDAGNGAIGGARYPYAVLLRELESKIDVDVDYYGADAERIEAHRVETLAALQRAYEEDMARANAEAERLEQERVTQAAERAKEEARAAAEAAAEEARQAQQRAHDEALAAAQRRAEEAEAARQQQEATRIAEAEEAARVAEETRKADEARAADIEHRAKIMKAAKVAIMGMGVGEQTAIAIVRAIAAGDVPAVSIQF